MSDPLVDAFDPDAQKKHEQYLKDGTYQRNSLKRAQAQSMAAAGIIRDSGALGQLQRRAATPDQVTMRPQAGFRPAPSLKPATPSPRREGGSRPSQAIPRSGPVQTISQSRPKPAPLAALNDLAVRLYTGGQDLMDTLGGKWAEPSAPPKTAGDWIGNLVTGGAKLPLSLATAPITGALTLQKLVTDATTQSALQKDLKARGMTREAAQYLRQADKSAVADLGGFLIPFSGEVSELAYGDPAKAKQMLFNRALSDPASLIMDAVGVAGVAHGARSVVRGAPSVARNVAEGARILRQPVDTATNRNPLQRAQAIETVKRVGRVLPASTVEAPAPSPGPVTARAGIPGFKPPKAQIMQSGGQVMHPEAQSVRSEAGFMQPEPRAVQPENAGGSLQARGQDDGIDTGRVGAGIEGGGAAGRAGESAAGGVGNPGETPAVLRPGGSGSGTGEMVAPADKAGNRPLEQRQNAGTGTDVPEGTQQNSGNVAAPGLRTELVAPEQVGILPGMQYKRGINKEGVTDLLKGQRDYEVEHGGTLTAYRDPAGNLLAVDGHHRRELAQRAERFTAPTADGSRTEVPRQLPVQILDSADGWNEASAKTFGVLKNLRENKGVAIDAADALSASLTPDQARAETQRLPRTLLARDVAGLVLLDEPGRTAVRNKQIPESVGSAIGEVLRGDTQRQRVAIEQAQSAPGIRSFDDGAALARAVRDEEIVAKQQEGGSLFEGDDSIGGARFQSTAGEQAMIAQSVKRRLQTEQSGLLAVEKTQAREGEQFDIAGRREEAGQVQAARSKADALLEFDPEVKGILRQAAADVMNGRIGRDEGVKRVREVLIKNGSANLAEIVNKGMGQPASPAPTGGGLFGGGQDSTAKPLPASDATGGTLPSSDSTLPPSDIKNRTNPAATRIAPAPLKDDAPARSAKEISLDLGKALGRRLDYGAKGRGKGVLGTFFSRSKRTTVRYRGDLDTTAHEVGHLIDDATGLVGDYASARQKSPFDAELIPNFSQYGSGTASGARGTLAYHRAEGVAEFIRAYLFNPDEARRQAPLFTRHFEAKAAAVLPQLRAFGDEVRRVAALDPVDRGMLSIAWEPGRKTPAEKLKLALQGEGYDFEVTAWDRFKTRWIDDAHPAVAASKWLAEQQGIELKPTNDFEMNLRTYVGGEATRIRQMIESGIESPDGKKLTGGGMAWVLEPIVGRRKGVDTDVLEADMKKTALMMIAERTIELSQRPGMDADRISGLGKGLFSDTAEAQKILAQLQSEDPAAYKRMQKSAERYRELSRGMLQYMVDAGRISQEDMNTITAGNQFYVDFSRDLDRQGFGLPGGGVAKGKNPVKRIKGGLDEINNPFTSLIENGFQMIGEADRNRVMRTFRDLVKPGTNDNNVNLSAIADEMPALYNQGTGGMEAPRDTITVYVDGKPEYWRINIPEVKKYLEGLGRESVPQAFQATLGPLTKLMKAGVTNSPGYIIRNLIRDQVERPFKSRVGGNLGDNFRAIPKGTEAEFFLSGGGQFGSHVATVDGYNGALRKSMREIAKDPNAILAAPGKIMEGYNRLKEKGELVTRLQEYNKAKQYAKDKLGYSEADARLYAAYQARDLMDFAIAGEWGRTINAFIPFGNSKIQGARRTYMAMRENPVRFAANLAIMGASGAALLAIIKATGEDRLEEYREIPAYRRDLYWCIPVPKSSKWIYIPKGFEVAVMASAVERAANYAMGDKRAWEGYLSAPDSPVPGLGGTVAQNLIPLKPDELLGITKTLAGALANYDFFRQKTIVPSFENDKPLSQRDTSGSSRMAQWIEKILIGIPAGSGRNLGVDARKIDYAFSSMAGNLGRDVTRISDLGRADKPLSTVGEFALSQTGVVGSAPGGEAISVQEAMRRAKNAGMSKNPLKAEFDSMRAAKDPREYDLARRELVRQAKSPDLAASIQEADTRRQALDAASEGDKEARSALARTSSSMLRGKRAEQSYGMLSTQEIVDLARVKGKVIDAIAKQSGAAPGSEQDKRVRRRVSSDLSGIPPESLREMAKQYGVR